MALVMVPLYMGKPNQEDNLPKLMYESAIRFNRKEIIPLLKSKPSEFDMQFDNAIMQYSTYSYQLLSLLTSMFKDKPQLSRELTDSTLSMLTNIQKDFLKIGNKRITKPFVNALPTLENYILLADDPSVYVSKPKYNAALVAYFGIMVCLIAILEILKSKNSRYKRKTISITKKCQTYAEMLERYVEIISKDHGRELTKPEMDALKHIDSGRAKITRFKNVDDYVKHLDQISNE
jgi:hypothetical protein